ncbi:MAG TPA: sigma 54-interacting transcriptional regulator [Polyangiaceae bacterium]
MVAWSLAEPQRLGEVALLGDESPRQILGRGGALADDGSPRVRFLRQRPGVHEERPPLAAPGLSRRQIELAPSPTGVAFERIGRCAVRHNGVACERGVLRAGDVLTLQNQLILFCTRRPTTFPGSRGAEMLAFGEPDRDGIVGESPAAWRLRQDLALVAASAAHVLVLGASGVGKELAARAIHRLSPRAGRALVARSAATLPSTLLDAELFGNRKNYPHADMPEREGVVGAANGGTLFLDEIGELSAELQTHLLRLLDAGGEYHRLGESHARRSDLRFVAATNRAPGELKHDLAARLAIHVTVPGLDARAEDVPLLARHLLDEIVADRTDLRERFFEKRADGSAFARLDPAFVELLLRRSWTLHVRELLSLLWASMRESSAHYLTIPSETSGGSEPLVRGDAGEVELSRETIARVLARHAGNQSKAYVELGLPSRFALRRLLRKHGIDPRRLDE